MDEKAAAKAVAKAAGSRGTKVEKKIEKKEQLKVRSPLKSSCCSEQSADPDPGLDRDGEIMTSGPGGIFKADSFFFCAACWRHVNRKDFQVPCRKD